MDLELLVKRIDQLENQIASLRKVVNSQNDKLNDVDEKAVSFLEKTRDQKNEVAKLYTIVNNLGQFDSAITKTRVDFNKQLEEVDKRNQLNIKMLEKLHTDEMRSINQSLDKSSKDLTQLLEQKIKIGLEENSRLIQNFKEIERIVQEKLNSSEDFRGSLALMQTEVQQNKKLIENLINDFEVYKKRTDEMRSKTDIILDGIRSNETQLNEIVATENDRKQTFISFMEQQTLLKGDRDRIWKEWETQFKESVDQVYKLIPELQNQQLEMKKTKDTFDEVSQRIDRRVNEITEIYRLLDEKSKREWTSFKSDLEKRWASVSLLLEDKQTDLLGQFEKVNGRILVLEDNSHNMQEALILMSKEIQKGMQSLMTMVNGWLDAFDQIK